MKANKKSKSPSEYFYSFKSYLSFFSAKFTIFIRYSFLNRIYYSRHLERYIIVNRILKLMLQGIFKASLPNISTPSKRIFTSYYSTLLLLLYNFRLKTGCMRPTILSFLLKQTASES